MIVPEELIHFFTYPVTVISILANLTLIFIILTTHNQHASCVGAYRYLLLSFAVVDILISIVHFVVVPSIHMTEFGFIFYGFRFMRDETAIGVATDLMFIALFYQTFVLLAFHYVYRYILLCNPPWSRWIAGNHPYRNWTTVAVTIDVVYIGVFMLAIQTGWVPNDYTRHEFYPMLKKAYNIDLEGPNQPGYLGIAYRQRQIDGSYVWSLQSLFALFLVLLMFVGSAIVIIICIWKVRGAMAKAEAHMATRTRHMQNQLFRTLLVQTFVPTVTSYIPLGTLFVIPLTGWALDGFGSVIMMSTALFPLIDPFLVIFLVSGYRSRLPSFLRHLVTSTVHTSTVNTPRNESRNRGTIPRSNA